MATELPISDETLMAYVDGELDAQQAMHIEIAMQKDAQLAARVAMHRALRSQLQSELSSVLAEPVPDRLLNVLQARTVSNVIGLDDARQRKTIAAKHSWGTREWAAMAASLVVGVALGIYALNFNSSSLVIARGSEMLAQGKLANALTSQLASNAAQVNNQSIQMGISFRNHAGEYCRSFAVHDGNALAGLACKQQDSWRVQMLTQASSSNTTEFRQAGSTMPAAVLAQIEQQIDGEPLDADAEAAAQRAGWK